jgi:hypothetical protein
LVSAGRLRGTNPTNFLDARHEWLGGYAAAYAGFSKNFALDTLFDIASD